MVGLTQIAKRVVEKPGAEVEVHASAGAAIMQNRENSEQSVRKPWTGLRACASLMLFVAGALGVLQAQGQGARRPEPCGGTAAARDYWTPDGQAGDLQFNIPGGWRRIDERGFLALTPTGLQPRQMSRIGFLPPQTLTTDVRRYFEGIWAQWRTQFNMIDNGDPETAHNAKGFDVLSRYSRIYSPSLGNGTFRFAVAFMGNRAEAFYFIDNTGNIDYEEAFRGFESSVQFVNLQKPSLPEPGVPCGLNGLYTGWKKTTGYRNGVIHEGLLEIEILVFFPDGNVIRHLPEQGLKNFDFGVELKNSRAYCGRYRMIADQVRITWADDNTETGNVEGSNLRIEGWSYIPAANSDGWKLNATYRTSWAPSGPRIRFTPDGRFIENGILDSVDYHGPDKSRGAGAYNIEHNTVELHYANGRTVPLSFFVFATDQAGESPKLIHLNGKDFVLTQ
jgi:hypothetical protein